MLGDKMSQTGKKKCLGSQTYSVGKPHGEQSSPEFCMRHLFASAAGNAGAVCSLEGGCKSNMMK